MTLDAIHCNRETCIEIVENAEGNFFIGVKENQKSFLSQIKKIFAENKPDDSHSSKDKGHGREEYRKIEVIKADETIKKPYVKTVVRIYRRRKIIRAGKVVDTETETSYAASSLPVGELSGKRAASLARKHWGIENKLHHRKDASMMEDRYRANNGMARILAALRSLAALVLDPVKMSNIVAMRRIAGNLHYATQLVTSKSLEMFRLDFFK